MGKEKSRLWHWLVILVGSAILGYLLIQAGQNQENPGPPKKSGYIMRG